MFKDCGSYFMYVPENYTGSLNVAIYYPGAGGAGALTSPDALPWVDYVNTNPNQIVIINKGASDNSDVIYNDLNNIGVDYGDVNVFCHSLGDVAGLDTAGNGKNYGFNVTSLNVMDSNAQLAKYEKMSREEAQALADSGTTVVLFNQRDWAMDANRTKPLTDAGVPLMYITCKTDVSNVQWNDTNHALINAQPIQNGYPDLLTGNITSLPIEPTATRGAHQILDYEFNWFDYETNSWVNITKSEAENILSSIGKSLSDYIPNTLPSGINTGKLVNISADGIRIDLGAAVGNLPSRDNLLVYKGELSSFLGSSMLSALSTDASDSSRLINLINNFISNGILKGESWNIAYEKLGIYNEKLNERIMAANELGEALRSAVSALLGCMTDYDMIDTSKLEELKQQVIELERLIADLYTHLYKEETYTDEKGNTCKKTVKDEGVERQIKALEEEKREIEKYIAAIEKLQATYDGVKPTLEAALAKVSAFSNEIASITPSPSYVYTA